MSYQGTDKYLGWMLPKQVRVYEKNLKAFHTNPFWNCSIEKHMKKISTYDKDVV